MKKGFTLIELLIVIAIIAILAAIAVPNFLEAQTRAKVSRAKTDMRSMSVGLEAYYVDNNNYPMWASQTGSGTWTSTATDYGHANGFAGDGVGASSIHSFAVRTGIPDFVGSTGTPGANLWMTMTTPISYLASYFPDPFTDTKGATYGYYSQKAGWILYSFGPDVDEAPDVDDVNRMGDIDPTVETLYDYHIAQPTIYLVTGWSTKGNGQAGGAFTYDPTNGTTSEGDVYRVKQ